MQPDYSPSPSPLSRRQALSILGMGGAALLAGCSTTDNASEAASGVTTAEGEESTSSDGSSPVTIGASTATPGETGGPFPADGSNDNGTGLTADVLGDERSVRRDIRSDLDGSNTQDGIPFELTMNVLRGDDATALSGAAVYIWHCSKDGVYSAYDSPMLDGDYSARTFLRGVQITDDDGQVSFQTILPGRYQGRAFHIHFEIFADDTYSSKILTSQMAVDDDLIDQLYSDAGQPYASSLRNDTDNAQDNIFSDGVEHKLLTVEGDVSGLRASFTAIV